MDGPVKSDARLEVSVSFGRFENDGLSWEKWSSFSPNKYLEEAGTLSTPGSVAQKKAYVEAHYKKVAAKKAEVLEQEKSMGLVVLSPDVLRRDNCIANSSAIDGDFGLSNGERLVEEVAQEACTTPSPNGTVVHKAEYGCIGSPKGDERETCINDSVEAITLKEEKEDAALVVKCGGSAVEETKDDSNGNMKGAELDIIKDSQSVGLETLQKGSQHTVEKPPGRKNVSPRKKDRTLAATTPKVEAPAVKQLRISTPSYSKPSSTPTPKYASITFKKQVNRSQLLKSQNSLVGESKRVAPTSLHMSLSLGSAKSLTASSTTRKSLIMEKMGHKDIIKRAFKTFQNRSNESTSDGKPTSVKHMLAASVELNISASCTPTQGNEGLRKDSEKQATQRSPSGARSTQIKGSRKNSAPDRKNMTAISPSAGIRSDEKTGKRKEFLKKEEAKSIARESGNTQLITKSKVLAENGTHL